MQKTTTFIVAVALFTTVALLGGCASDNYNGPITSESYQSNPSPELSSLTRATEQSDNHLATVSDLNLRQIPDDLAAIFLLDRPSHLTPYPVP